MQEPLIIQTSVQAPASTGMNGEEKTAVLLGGGGRGGRGGDVETRVTERAINYHHCCCLPLNIFQSIRPASIPAHIPSHIHSPAPPTGSCMHIHHALCNQLPLAWHLSPPLQSCESLLTDLPTTNSLFSSSSSILRLPKLSFLKHVSANILCLKSLRTPRVSYVEFHHPVIRSLRGSASLTLRVYICPLYICISALLVIPCLLLGKHRLTLEDHAYRY